MLFLLVGQKTVSSGIFAVLTLFHCAFSWTLRQAAPNKSWAWYWYPGQQGTSLLFLDTGPRKGLAIISNPIMRKP